MWKAVKVMCWTRWKGVWYWERRRPDFAGLQYAICNTHYTSWLQNAHGYRCSIVLFISRLSSQPQNLLALLWLGSFVSWPDCQAQTDAKYVFANKLAQQLDLSTKWEEEKKHCISQGMGSTNILLSDKSLLARYLGVCCLCAEVLRSISAG